MGAERGRELIERMRSEVVLGDGPMGTTLYQRGIPLGSAFELLNVKDPDLVKSIHRQFVVAGAEVIETNTFGANAWRLRPHGLEDRVRELNERGAELARAVAGNRACVGGSVGPLGRKGGEPIPDGADEMYRDAVTGLAAGGADLLFLETFTDLEELSVAFHAARRHTDLPVVVQLALMEHSRTAKGVSLAEGCRHAALLGADVFGTNCGKGPRAVVDAMEDLVRSGAVPDRMLLTASPNAGFPELVNGRYIYLTTPEYMADCAQDLAEAGVSLIGGCCGTTAADVSAMRFALKGRSRVAIADARVRLEKERGPAPPSPVPADAAPTGRPLAHALQGPGPGRLDFLRSAAPGSERPTVIVEIDPPKDLDPTRGMRTARRLAEAGADAITVGDNPLAVMRMSAVAFSHLVQQYAGIPVVTHLSCRDRNLIGTQSTLSGAHVLGLRAILAITGDPASIGGQPGASSVYDMNSFGLVELIARLNRGENFVGEPLKDRTDFTIGVAFNPNGRRIDDQLRRLREKVDRGAQFAQTQPCYTTERVRTMYERAAPLKIPIFLGLLPLFSERAARFVHNEVPGIDVPDFVIERLHGLSKEDGREEGIRIRLEQVEATLDCAHGYYVIPPFNSSKAALRLIVGIREAAARRAARVQVG